MLVKLAVARACVNIDGRSRDGPDVAAHEESVGLVQRSSTESE